MMNDRKNTRTDNYVRYCPLDDDNLKSVREVIFNIGDVTGGFAPSLNKIVNDVLRDTDLERVQLSYINQIQKGTSKISEEDNSEVNTIENQTSV